jgi:hypothetical protein
MRRWPLFGCKDISRSTNRFPQRSVFVAAIRGETIMNFLRRLFPSELNREELSPGSTRLTKTSREQYSRECTRVRLKCWVKILVKNSEQCQRELSARAVDVSGSGALVETCKPLEVGTLVYFRGKEVNFLAGSACVRHCTWWGWKYRIGLEFRTTLSQRF